MRIIQRIQNKPEHVRWKIFLVALVVSMTLIIMLWVSTIKNDLFTLMPEHIQPETHREASTASPFDVLKDGFTLVFGDFLEGVRSIKAGFTE